MKVAAYQAPLLAPGSMEAIDLIRDQIKYCESEGVEILCCPEGVLGGLADYSQRPFDIALEVQGARLQRMLAPLSSEKVTTILGFTELGDGNRLFNSAAVFHKGAILGVYRKHHPAINRSIYEPGSDATVFTVGDLTFGIVICRDSVHREPARHLVEQGVVALFVPTNNGLPPAKRGAELVDETRRVDIARAIESRVSVIRADVAGRANDLVSYGSSGIVDRHGTVLQSARQLESDLLVANIVTSRADLVDRIC